MKELRSEGRIKETVKEMIIAYTCVNNKGCWLWTGAVLFMVVYQAAKGGLIK